MAAQGHPSIATPPFMRPSVRCDSSLVPPSFLYLVPFSFFYSL